MNFIDKVKAGQGNILLYGITPPKKTTDEKRIAEIAQTQVKRLQPLGLDGLVIYDIQDEASRTRQERPFPFIETHDPWEYGRNHLGSLGIPFICYRAVGKYSRQQLIDFMTHPEMKKNATVFVGASSRHDRVNISLNDAYELKNEVMPSLLSGGVAIPERHMARHDEHLRLAAKTESGSSFFISQGVYHLDNAKSLLSDIYYHSHETERPTAPVIFTFTPCGSLKTLEFMKWLGISIPRWLENELVHSKDILQQSVLTCLQIWHELKAFADRLGVPVGCNIESVAIRKEEIEASIELVNEVKKTLV